MPRQVLDRRGIVLLAASTSAIARRLAAARSALTLPCSYMLRSFGTNPRRLTEAAARPDPRLKLAGRRVRPVGTGADGGLDPMTVPS